MLISHLCACCAPYFKNAMDSAPRHSTTWPLVGHPSPFPTAPENEALRGEATGDGDHDSELDTERPDSPQQQSWEAVSPPAGYPSINYRPVLLQTSVLCAAGTIFLSAMMALAALAWTSDSSRAYRVDNVNYFIALRYGPAILGAVSQTLFQQIARQFLSVMPFVNMASRGRPKGARKTVMAMWWPFMNDAQGPELMALNLLLAISSILIGLKIFLIEIVEKEGYWATYVHPVTAWCLAGYYAATFTTIVWILVLLSRNQTGLRPDWDPECIADYIALFYHFNVPAMQNLGSRRPWRLSEDILDYTYRLGYWKRTNSTSVEIAYGIMGARGGVVPCAGSSAARSGSLGRHGAKKARKQADYPYRVAPYWTYFSWLSLLILPAILGLLFVTAATGYLKHGFFIEDTFSMLRLDQASAYGINATAGMSNLTIDADPTFMEWGPNADWRGNRLLLVNFIIRGVPMYLLLLALSGISNTDLAYRIYRPVHNLTAHPCSAMDSLLMDYFTRSPFAVSADALSKGYGKVFFLSIMGSAAPVLALIPFGIMTLTTTVNGVIIGQFSMVSFIGTVILTLGILGCYLLVFPFIPYRHHELVPWRWLSPIHIWSTFQGSELAQLPEFGRCEENWTKDHLRAAIIMRNQKYQIGIAAHRNGNQLIGADIFCDEQNVPTGLVDGVRPRHRRTAQWVLGLFRTEPDVKNADEIPLDDRQRARTVDQTNQVTTPERGRTAFYTNDQQEDHQHISAQMASPDGYDANRSEGDDSGE